MKYHRGEVLQSMGHRQGTAPGIVTVCVTLRHIACRRVMVDDPCTQRMSRKVISRVRPLPAAAVRRVRFLHDTAVVVIVQHTPKILILIRFSKHFLQTARHPADAAVLVLLISAVRNCHHIEARRARLGGRGRDAVHIPEERIVIIPTDGQDIGIAQVKVDRKIAVVTHVRRWIVPLDEHLDIPQRVRKRG